MTGFVRQLFRFYKKQTEDLEIKGAWKRMGSFLGARFVSPPKKVSIHRNTQLLFWALRLLPLFPLLALGMVSKPMGAQESTKKRAIEFRWRPVAGAGTYQVQIRDQSGKILFNQRTKRTSVAVPLEPGEYERRVAAVNKFGKVSRNGWSKWQDFRVRVTARPKIRKIAAKGKEDIDGFQKLIIHGKNFLDSTQVFLVNPGVARQELPFRLLDSTKLEVSLKPSQFRDGNYSIAVVNPRGLEDKKDNSIAIQNRRLKTKETEEADEETTEHEGPSKTYDSEDLWGRFWPTLVPGLPGIQRGDTNGTLWAGAFAGSIILASLEYDAARIRKKELTDDPLYQAFNQPSILFGLAQNLSQIEILVWGYASTIRRAQIERKFNRHNRNQTIWSAVASTTWIGHYAYENRNYWKWTHLVPGWSHFKKGNTGRGIGWSAASGLTGAILAYSTYQQENLRTSRKNFQTNALLSFIAYNQIVDLPPSQAALFLGRAYDTAQIQNKQYNENTKIQRNASIAFLSLYLLQIMDATMMEAGKGGISAGIRQERFSAINPRTQQKPEIVHDIQWDYRF